jgi:hypothetical protein
LAEEVAAYVDAKFLLEDIRERPQVVLSEDEIRKFDCDQALMEGTGGGGEGIVVGMTEDSEHEGN